MGPAFSHVTMRIRETIVSAMDDKLASGTVASELVYGVLKALSLAYSAGLWVRKVAYRLQLLRTHVLPVPVISVGNVTVGGSGKTPMCVYLAKLSRMANLRPLVLTRGYGEDEDKMMMQLLDGVAGVGSGARRYEIGSHMLNNEDDQLQTLDCKYKHLPNGTMETSANHGLNYDLIILDDGLQHSRILRDFHVVMINCLDPPTQHKHLLPRGRLREPLCDAIKLADVIVVHNADKVSERKVQEVEDDVRSLAVNSRGKSFNTTERKMHLTVRSHFSPSRMTRLTCKGDQDREMPRRQELELSNCAVYCFAGIANPEGFFQSVKSLSPALYLGETSFPDHHKYCLRDLEDITQAAKRENQEIHEDRLPIVIITTEKDVARSGEMIETFFNQQQVEVCILGGDLVLHGDPSQLVELCLLPSALRRMLTSRPSS